MAGRMRAAVAAVLAAAFLTALTSCALTALRDVIDGLATQDPEDADGIEDSFPIAWEIRQTDSGDSANNVHQCTLLFQPGAAQDTSGLYFQVYVPNADYGGYDVASIAAPPMSDDGNDAVFDQIQTVPAGTPQTSTTGYRIAIEKIDGANEWLIEVCFLPTSGASGNFGVVGSGDHTATSVNFTVVARSVALPNPASGQQLGTRTRAEYIAQGQPASLASGTTGLSFDAPPLPIIAVAGSPIPARGIQAYSVLEGASSPLVDNMALSGTITNDGGALSGCK